MAQPPEPRRSQSTTSLSRFYHGAPGVADGEDGVADPKMDFCNAFWGQGERGYEVVMARLRGAGRTTDELRSFWKERIAIEEDYAKRLAKLAKIPLGRDEIGDLSSSLQNVLTETAQQGSYHSALAQELRESAEQPTAEFGARLANLKKGLQGSVEKAWRNKGLQEGHVAKAKERYESDCLKLNSYSANSQLVQGRELEKLQSKLERVRQTIGQNEQDFRQFVKVLEGTTAKWEQEWRAFCDHVQDLEEDRLALTKDIVWAYANAVSQVCVEDDSSCERIREKLETFEPQNDMLAFVQGWGTGDQIPDPPRFVNYSAGESFATHPTSRTADFRRLSSKPPMPAASRSPAAHDQPLHDEPNGHSQTNGLHTDMQKLNMSSAPPPQTTSPPPPEPIPKSPFGGVPLPGMTSPPPQTSLPERRSSMLPPPIPPAMTMPEPRVPSRQGPPTPRADVMDEEDPMAKALAELRREPPPPGSVRRAPSSRRPESLYSNTGSIHQNIKSPASPAPSNRMSYQPSASQQPPPSQHAPSQSLDMTLSPPASGHTAAALQKSMDDFHRASSRGPGDKRGSVNYSNFADDVVGAHPSSRPASPAVPHQRGPSPAMMQAPRQPPSPIADEVLGRYHQSLPGERSRSRAGSVVSGRSRAGSFVEPPQPQQQQPPPSPGRQAFAGIGAGGQPPQFRSPSPSPVVPQNPGGLGPQNLGIALDEKGGVAHDSMAEAYRRQYQQQQGGYGQQSQGGYGQQQQGGGYGLQQQQQPPPQQQQQQPGERVKSPSGSAFGRPTSNYGAPQQQQYPQQSSYAQSPAQPQGYGGYTQQAQQYGQQQQHQPPVASPQQQYPPQNTYQQSAQQYTTSPQPQQYPQYAPPQQQQYARSASPAPVQNQYARGPSPAPQQQQQYYNGGGASPQPQQQQARAGRSPSPQPGVPPQNAAPTGQWSTTGLPVLFYVKALYDYTALSAVEFDFQAGDIIAVTSTPEDGWWSGELLDEARRVPGRNDFPSNFVCLF